MRAALLRRAAACTLSSQTAFFSTSPRACVGEDVQLKLQAPDCRWDLVVCDEAHKLSATFFGGEVKYSKRYRLAQLLSSLTDDVAGVGMPRALAILMIRSSCFSGLR